MMYVITQDNIPDVVSTSRYLQNELILRPKDSMATEFLNGTLYYSISADELKKRIENLEEYVKFGSENFVRFANLYVTGILNFDQTQKGHLIFEQCIFKDSFTMIAIVYADEVKFERCTFGGACVIENSKFDSRFLLLECKFDHGLWITGDNIFKSDLRIDADCKSLIISGGSYKHLIIYSIDPDKHRRTIQTLRVNMRGVTGTIDLAELRIHTCSFGNVIEKGTSLLLHTLDISRLNLDEISNGGNIRIIDTSFVPATNLQTTFSIEGCSLGKTEFINLNLKRVTSVLISSSSLIECIFINVSWPKKYRLADRFDKRHGLLDQKDIFRQLKYAYNNKEIMFRNINFTH